MPEPTSWIEPVRPWVMVTRGSLGSGFWVIGLILPFTFIDGGMPAEAAQLLDEFLAEREGDRHG